MKQQTTTKWVLSAFLVSALASQYYFSVSSKEIATSKAFNESFVWNHTDNSGSFELSQVKEDDKKKTEADDCTQCSTIEAIIANKSLTPEQQAKAINKLLEEQKNKTADKKEEKDEDEKTCKEKFTKTYEVLKCEREERERLAKEKDKDKKAKDREKILTNNENFNNDMADAYEQYKSEPQELVEKYTSLLSEYTGRKQIDVSVAQKAYDKYIKSVLKAQLAKEDSDVSNEMIEKLMTDIPEEFSKIKKDGVAATVKQSTTERITSLNETYKNYQTALDKKDVNGAFQLFKDANSQYTDLYSDVYGNALTGQKGYQQVMLGDDVKDADASTWDWVKSTFYPDMNKLWGTVSFNGTSTTNTNNNNTNTRNNGRGGTNTNTNTNNNNTNGNGVNFQNPTNNRTNSGRGGVTYNQGH